MKLKKRNKLNFGVLTFLALLVLVIVFLIGFFAFSNGVKAQCKDQLVTLSQDLFECEKYLRNTESKGDEIDYLKNKLKYADLSDKNVEYLAEKLKAGTGMEYAYEEYVDSEITEPGTNEGNAIPNTVSRLSKIKIEQFKLLSTKKCELILLVKDVYENGNVFSDYGDNAYNIQLESIDGEWKIIYIVPTTYYDDIFSVF